MTTECSLAILESALTGGLPAADEAALHRHLEECESCGAALERLAGGNDWCREAAALLTKDELDEAVPTREDWSAIDFTVEHLEPSEEPNVLGRLGGYDVLEIIGHGGNGVVLKAFDRELKRCVAIKVLAPHLALSSLAKKRFAREAQAAAAIVHPNVLAIHQVQPSGRLPFLVMPLVAGESLAQRLSARGTLELNEILRIGMQAAAGLAAAHEQGLVHRDVKPANILLEKGVERAVLTDFGLARAADDATLTRWGIIAGTPQYMSPEQARGEPLDGRSDLFSLGCVLYEMATGVSPFRTESMMATMRRLVDDSPQAMASLNPELPPWFIAIVGRLLEKEPSKRFNSAKEVSELLEGCLAHVQQPTSVPLPAGVPLPPPPSRAGGVSPRSSLRALLRTRIPRFVYVLAGLLAAGIGAWAVFMSATDSPDIAGEWSGEGWGQVVLTQTAAGQYSGTYSDTVGKSPGKIELKWSRIERRFNGTWREGEDRLGELSLRLSGNEIRGALTTDAKSKINPATPRLADLLWTRAEAYVEATPAVGANLSGGRTEADARALQFDGTGYVRIPGDRVRKLQSGTLAVSIRPTTDSKAEPLSSGVIISSLHDTSNDRQFYPCVLDKRDGTFSVTVVAVNKEGRFDFCMETDNQFSMNAWHDLIYTSVQGHGRFDLYVDGKSQPMHVFRFGRVTDFFYSDLMQGGDDLQIGAKSDSHAAHNSFFHGAMRDLMFFDQAFSQEQVAAAYAGGGDTVNISRFVREGSLVAGYHLNEGNGTTIADFSGNGNTGTLKGGVKWDVPARGAVLRYDAAADFSTAKNPNGVWSYGWEATLGGDFKLLRGADTKQQPDFPPDKIASSMGYFPAYDIYYPFVAKNMTDKTVITSGGHVPYLPGQLLMHPSNDGGYSVVRFTAPSDGSYGIRSTFEGRDDRLTTTDVHVLCNGHSLFKGNINGFGKSTDQSLNTTASLRRGDTVDFLVGWGENRKLKTSGSNGPLKVRSLPEGWKLKYDDTKGINFYSIAPQPDGGGVLMFSRWSPGGKSSDVPAVVRQIADGYVEELKKLPGHGYKNGNYDLLPFAGEYCQGDYGVFKIANTGSIQVMFAMSVNGQIWNGQFTGTPYDWHLSLELLKALSLNDANLASLPQITADIKILEVPANVKFDAAKPDFDALAKEKGAQLLQAPRITVFNGQEALVSVSNEESSRDNVWKFAIKVRPTLDGDIIHYVASSSIRKSQLEGADEHTSTNDVTRKGDTKLDTPTILDIATLPGGGRGLVQIVFVRAAPVPEATPPNLEKVKIDKSVPEPEAVKDPTLAIQQKVAEQQLEKVLTQLQDAQSELALLPSQTGLSESERKSQESSRHEQQRCPVS